MSASPDDPHVLLGAYVLGGLSDDDHRAFTEHLRGCAQCQQELGQVSGLPRLLELAGPTGGPHVSGDLAAAGSEPASATRDASSLLAEVARRRRRRRGWLGGAAAAALAASFAAGSLIGPGLLTTEPPTTHIVAAAASDPAVRVDVALVTRGWGTQLDLDCEDMPTDGQLALWVTDASGTTTNVASWRATKSGYARVTGATALRPNEIRAVEIKTSTGAVVASATT